MPGTSQDLVPTGQPYGDRQKTVAALQAADLPLDSGAAGDTATQAPLAAVPPTATSAAPVNRRQGADLGNYDVFANRDPSGVIPPPDAPDLLTLFQTRAAQTQNPAMQYYLGRVSEFLE